MSRPAPQITDQFLEAYASRRIPKKWVHDALKEHADWKGKTTGWVLRLPALALLSGAAMVPAGGPALSLRGRGGRAQTRGIDVGVESA